MDVVSGMECMLAADLDREEAFHAMLVVWFAFRLQQLCSYSLHKSGSVFLPPYLSSFSSQFPFWVSVLLVMCWICTLTCVFFALSPLVDCFSLLPPVSWFLLLWGETYHQGVLFCYHTWNFTFIFCSVLFETWLHIKRKQNSKKPTVSECSCNKRHPWNRWTYVWKHCLHHTCDI